jgi:hypothetical protein
MIEEYLIYNPLAQEILEQILEEQSLNCEIVEQFE